VGWFLSLHLGERAGLPRPRMEACFLVTALAALAGGRALHVAANLDDFASLADVVRLSSGGMVAYGGFLGGLVGSVVYCRRAGLPVLVWGDCAVPTLGTGLLLTRTGCLLNGCDFGAPWDGPWALRFPPGSPAFREHVARSLVPADAAASLPVHPTQIYEALAGLALLVLVALVRRRGLPGAGLAAFAVGYAVLRFLIEMWRDDPRRGWVGPLSQSQFIAVLTCAAGIALLLRLRASRRPRPAAATGRAPTVAAA
jgi:phosphatidylglycerol---prolipoprotein diacylglyceryl transferase